MLRQRTLPGKVIGQTLFGSEAIGGSAVLPVEEAAACAGTLSYELLVRVGARVRRVFVDDGASV